MRKFLLGVILFVIFLPVLLLLWTGTNPKSNLPQVQRIIEKPFEKYTIESLSNTKIEPGYFSLTTKLGQEKEYTSHLFNFKFKPDFNNFKTMTGQINLPLGGGSLPIILMIRGYVDQKTYKTGDGTRNAANFFARNGFITVSPDFLGYAGSDTESGNIFETRFQTYVTVLTLLKSFESPPFAKATGGKWDGKNIFIWAHSNGGQVALTALEILGKNYPTTLWAPVTKPFPYSVLYYTNQSDDGGKLIRRELARFEDTYDTDLYSLTEYLDKLQAKIQINQGTNDDAVPVDWSRNFVKILKSAKKEVLYNEYPGNDHNMRPDWDHVIVKDLEFFKYFIIQ